MYVLPPLSLSHMAHLGAKVIENLTQKANNFKRFRTFVDMLLAAVREEERRKGTLLLDLLTEEDLATFKARETSTPSLELANYVHPSLQARRFLLLTYAAPYDRSPSTRHARELSVAVECTTRCRCCARRRRRPPSCAPPSTVCVSSSRLRATTTPKRSVGIAR